MIVNARIVGHSLFTSKAGKDLCIVSWLEPYQTDKGKGAAAYSGFVGIDKSAAFLDKVGSSVKCYTSHRNGFHTIDLLDE